MGWRGSHDSMSCMSTKLVYCVKGPFKVWAVGQPAFSAAGTRVAGRSTYGEKAGHAGLGSCLSSFHSASEKGISGLLRPSGYGSSLWAPT